MSLCQCGCGQEAPEGKDYVQGHWLKSVQKKAKDNDRGLSRAKLYQEFGAHGTPIFAGVAKADYLSKFQSLSTALETYEKMRRSDATCQACLLVMELPILASRFFVRSASDSAQDEEIADFVQWNLMEGMSHTFSDFLRQALGKFWAGFSWFEKVFEPYGNLVKWKKLAVRSQATLDRWVLDDQGGPKAAVQTAWRPDEKSYVPIEIPIEKLIVFINRKEAGNLQGNSFFRAAYKHWLIKDKLYRLEAIALERSAVGIPVMVLPRNSSADDKATAKDIVTTLRQDEKAGVTIPDTWSLSLLGGGGSAKSGSVRGLSRGGAKVTSYQATIQHHDLMIAKSILAQFIQLPGSAYGSYALSADQSTLLLQNLNYEADSVCDSMNRYAIPQLVKLNWPKTERFPKLDHSPISSRNIKVLANAWKLLASSDLIKPSPETESYIREIIGFPEVERQGFQGSQGSQGSQESENLELEPESEEPSEAENLGEQQPDA